MHLPAAERLYLSFPERAEGQGLLQADGQAGNYETSAVHGADHRA